MADDKASRRYADNQNFYYDLLDKIGYSKSLAKKRIEIYANAERCANLIAETEAINNNHIEVKVAGSRGEGVGVCLDSDIDILFIQRRVKCFENCACLVEETHYSATFKLDFENVPSGYAKLCVETLHRDPFFGLNVRDALVRINGSYYLSNNQLLTSMHYPGREGFFKQQAVFPEVTGPARSINFGVPNVMTLHFDYVQAIPCEYPSIVNDWCTRKRRNNWPSADLIEKVKTLDVLVVPTGVSDSFEEGLQWRISMTLAERTLVRSFNDVQIKLYAAMKMLVNHELKPFCKNITSYIVKNIVFWVFEGKELNNTKVGFNISLRQCLQYLKLCVHWQYLPNYMIPRKNMFECKISGKQKRELIKHLTRLLDEGSHALLRCPLVREMVTLPRTKIQRKLLFREFIEQFCLSVVSIHPADYAEIEKKLFRNLNRDKLVTLVRLAFNYLIPMIRRTNPSNFFTHLVSMTNDEICMFLLEGIRLGYFQKE